MSIIQGNAKQGSTRGFYSFPIEQSLRFNDDDSAYLSWTPDSAGDRRTWTLSCWVKRAELGSENVIFAAGANAASATGIAYLYFSSGDTLSYYRQFSGSGDTHYITNAVFRDPSAWYHVVVVEDTDNTSIKLYVNGVEQSVATSTGPSATDSPVNSTDIHTIGKRSWGSGGEFDGYLAEVNFIDGTALDADSFGELKNGVWIPKDPTGLTYGTNGFRLSFADDAEVEAFNTVLYRGNEGEQSITGMGFEPDLVWIKARSLTASHVIHDQVRGSNLRLTVDTTSAESVNTNWGSFDADGFTLASGGNSYNNSGDTYVAWGWDAGANNTPTGHSSVTYTGSGANQTISGMPFQADLLWIKERDGTDDHALYDSVRTLESRLESNNTDAEVISYGAIRDILPTGFTLSNSGQLNESGKSYVAWGWDAGDGDPVSNTDGSITSTVKASAANGFSIVSYTGNADASKTIGHGLSTAPDMIIVKGRNVAQDWIVYHSANTGSPETQRLYLNGATATDTVTWWNNTAPTSSVFSVSNFNGTGNAYNYIAYCFHDVTGKQKFGTYTGTGANLDITLGFRAGWVMIKRTDSTDNWYIFDSSRDPFGMTRSLYADASSSEGDSAGRTVTVDADGMVLGSNSAINASGGTYIYAAFAGSYSDYITDYNTDGSIDSRVKANDTTGFSIVSYTGGGSAGTIGHGLSSEPKMLIVKRTDGGTGGWYVYHHKSDASIPQNKYLELQGTGAVADASWPWNDTAPTSSVFSVGSDINISGSGNTFIAYCWAEKAGYSKFGSYTGGTNPKTVTTGFPVAFVLIKATSGSNNWIIYDRTRDVGTVAENSLCPDSSAAENGISLSNDNVVEFTSDGFKLTTTNFLTNGSGVDYIYAAFADTREAAFWLDQSGNDNDWQPVNLDHNDTVADSPTDNFATFNPLTAMSTITLSEGNLKAVVPTNESNYYSTVYGTTGFSSGKFYWEATTSSSADGFIIGIDTRNTGASLTSNAIYNSGTYGYRFDNGNKWVNGTQTSFGPSSSVGDIIGIAIDMDAGTFKVYKNGSLVGTLATGITGTAIPLFQVWYTVNAHINFGQQPFKYDPPA